MTSNPGRALAGGARAPADCISSDPFRAIGGTLAVARQDITLRINRLSDALQALRAYGQEDLDASAEAALTVAQRAQDSQPHAMRAWVEEEGYPGSLVPSPEKGENPMSRAASPPTRENPIRGATIGPEALERLEADQTGGDPPDPHNAHVQGADHAE